MRECQVNCSFIYLFPLLNFVFPEGTSLSPFLTLFNKVLQILPSKYLWLLSLPAQCSQHISLSANPFFTPHLLSSFQNDNLLREIPQEPN